MFMPLYQKYNFIAKIKASVTYTDEPVDATAEHGTGFLGTAPKPRPRASLRAAKYPLTPYLTFQTNTTNQKS